MTPTIHTHLATLDSLIATAERICAEHAERRAAARDLTPREKNTIFPQIEGSEMGALKPMWPQIRAACHAIRPFLDGLSDAGLADLEAQVIPLHARFEALHIHVGTESLCDMIQG